MNVKKLFGIIKVTFYTFVPMNLLRKILLPIVPLYYLIVWIRNKMYDLGIKKSTTYKFPIIAVGNLSVGGTGKSPMVEYLIKILKEKRILATLSRGYKRETKGFQIVQVSSTAKDIGDEPLQFKTKFPNILVGVDADRRNGIAQLRSCVPQPEVVIMDDGFQHRKVKAGFYILLTAYYDLYCDDVLLPTGNLREPIMGANRANLIVVSKCPKTLSFEEKKEIQKKLKIKENQSLFFSTIDYEKELVGFKGKRSIDFFKTVSFTLVTGIANPRQLLDYYTSLGLIFTHVNFPDHHSFSIKEIEELKNHEYIITTEKDYMRLAKELKENIWYQPMIMKFLEGEDSFKTKVLEYIEDEI